MTPNPPHPAPRLPEILAPAGDMPSLLAALQAGADAVYFGLDEGLNARARAQNFPVAELPATCDRIHRAGARAFLTLNTVVFEDELPFLEGLVRAARKAWRRVERMKLSGLAPEELHRQLDLIQADLGAIHRAVAKQYFELYQEAATPVAVQAQ